MNRSNQIAPTTSLVVLAFATVYIVWGSTYFFIQKALHGFPALLLGGLRFTVSGLLMLGWSKFRGEDIWNRKSIKYASVAGMLLLFVGNGAVIWVEQFMPSAMVAIFVSTSPFWFIILDKPKWKENFSSRSTIIGLIIGFAGILLLFGEKVLQAFTGNHAGLGGMLLLLVGGMSWAAGSLYSKSRTSNVSATVNTSWQMLAAGIAFIPFSLLHGDAQIIEWSSISLDAWLSVLYLIVFGSIIGFSAFVWLLRVRPVTQVSTYAYVNPVVAVLLGIFFANEHITLIQICGLCIILFSVFMINLAKYRSNLNGKKHPATQEFAPQQKEETLVIKPTSALR